MQLKRNRNANAKMKNVDLTKPDDTGINESSEPQGSKVKKKRLINDGPRLPFLKNKVAIAIAAISIAAVLSFVISPIINALSKGKTETILVAAEDISQGTVLNEGMLKPLEVPVTFTWEGSISNAEQLVGQYATTPIKMNDPITLGKCSASPPYSDTYLHVLPKGEQAMSISIKDFAEGVSGKLLPGDVITIYAMLKNNGQDQDYHAIQPPELSYVEILAVTTTYGKDLDEEQKTKYQETGEEQPQTTVTLQVNPVQASALAGLNSSATIHLALTSRGDPEEKAALLEQQKLVLSKDPNAEPEKEE